MRAEMLGNFVFHEDDSRSKVNWRVSKHHGNLEKKYVETGRTVKWCQAN